MANTLKLSPLSKDQIDNLYTEINDVLEAEFKEVSQPGVNLSNCDVLPTTETFDKAEMLNILRMLEPNPVVFYQDIQVCTHILFIVFIDDIRPNLELICRNSYKCTSIRLSYRLKKEIT